MMHYLFWTRPVFLLDLLAASIYMLLACLLIIKMKQRTKHHYKPVWATKAFVAAISLNALYYLLRLVLLFYDFPIFESYRLSDCLFRALLAMLPFYCIFFASVSSTSTKRGLTKRMLLSLAVCLGGAMGLMAFSRGSVTPALAFNYLMNGVYVASLLTGFFLVQVMAYSSELGKKLFQQQTQFHRVAFIVIWIIAVLIYALSFFGNLWAFSAQFILALWLHIIFFFPLAFSDVTPSLLHQQIVDDNGNIPTSLSELDKALLRREKSYDLFYDKLIEYMDKQKPYLQTKLNKEALAAAIGTNTLYLSQIVNQKTHMTIKQWVNQYRINYAKEYFLSHKTSKVMDLCIVSGFSSVPTFTVAFQLHEGTTPSEWCKKNISK